MERVAEIDAGTLALVHTGTAIQHMRHRTEANDNGYIISSFMCVCERVSARTPVCVCVYEERVGKLQRIKRPNERMKSAKRMHAPARHEKNDDHKRKLNLIYARHFIRIFVVSHGEITRRDDTAWQTPYPFFDI